MGYLLRKNNPISSSPRLKWITVSKSANKMFKNWFLLKTRISQFTLHSLHLLKVKMKLQNR